MAMTKAERAAMDALYERAALSWPAPPPKPIDLDVARAGAETEWVWAWWFNSHSREVGEGVTNGHLHARSPYTEAQLSTRFSSGSRLSLSQGAGGPWFASKIDALRAMHHAAAERFAYDLANIQRRVEAEASASIAKREGV